MATRTSTDAPPTLADLLEGLGDVSPRRIVLDPAPGKATEKDLLRLLRRDRLYELVDGTLVEKAMGYRESLLAGWLIFLLHEYLAASNLGEVSAPDGSMRLMPGLVRIPDVAFVRREKFPGGVIPDKPIPDLVPDLAIEVLSASNTPAEMKRKLKDYFITGSSQVWLVDPVARTVTVHTAPDACQVLTEKDPIDGGDLLPGLNLSVQRIFERTPSSDPAPAPRTRRKKA